MKGGLRPRARKMVAGVWGEFLRCLFGGRIVYRPTSVAVAGTRTLTDTRAVRVS